MKAIMVMFDSLNRHMLPPYGCDWVHASNFERLAHKTAVFDNCYVGSVPCMPARRELHTGRYNFLHRSWGPIEPFDDSMPEILDSNGIYTHLVSDHMHYWEDGGSTYHTRYKTWEIARGNQGDPWKGEVKDPEIPEHIGNRQGGTWRQEWINRKYIKKEEDMPQAKTFNRGIEFIKTNSQEDDWFLHIETFDPHEPYHTPQKYKDLYPHEYDGPYLDWPPYREVRESDDTVQHVRYENAALVSMCDKYLGKIMDVMDEHNLWEDTMLIVNTDHGFLLGEHGGWAKCCQPFYNEVAHIPLFIWDPRSQKKGERRKSLVQTIDLAPTLLHYFNIEIPKDMEGVPLFDTIKDDTSIREGALFGIHGGHVNCTDGRYVYMKAPETPENEPLYNYTLMPTHMRGFFDKKELQSMKKVESFSFTNDCPVMKMEASGGSKAYQFGDLLFDLKKDPAQKNPITDEAVEKRMKRLMVRLMKENDCPPEQFERLGLNNVKFDQ